MKVWCIEDNEDAFVYSGQVFSTKEKAYNRWKELMKEFNESNEELENHYSLFERELY